MRRVLGGLLSLLLVAGLGGLIVLVLNTCDGHQPDLDLPEEGDELWEWVEANPDRTICPDTPAEEGL